jgi:NAD(P)-dependent dehydrogenase (short-subunit alcohol dehydrogenase family)
MSKTFEDAVVLVTGGGSGIGQATALAFAEQGARVIVADINHTAALATAAQAGPLAQAVSGDVASQADVDAWIEAATQAGGLNVAVNCAGVEQPQSAFEDSDADTFERVMRVNAFGVWLCMRQELRAMLKSGGGAIVNVASIAGIVGSMMNQSYAASKHAVVGLTKCAALEFAARGIRVNAICPGPTLTPMLLKAGGNDPAILEALAQLVPMKRGAEPREMADAILYLSSSAASNITGVMLPVDGGWTVG